MLNSKMFNTSVETNVILYSVSKILQTLQKFN